MATRNFFVNAVGMVSFGGHESIPTAIRYRNDNPSAIGFEATLDSGDVDGMNEDFKIDLGNFKAGKGLSSRARFSCGDGEVRSSYNIADDFFSRVRLETAQHLSSHGMELAKNVLISEPLSFHANGNADWLENYRGNLRRILSGTFESIDFMPEPFAVYQYYRYGMRHVGVAEERKHCALVIDFGGGTFDASVVETTKKGDISQSGRTARPLGAHSTPIGGFEINREFARLLLGTAYRSGVAKEELNRSLENYFRVRRGELLLKDLSARNQAFLGWFGRFLRDVEVAKIELSRLISDWRLDAPILAAVTIKVPENPFQPDGAVIPLRITGESLRQLFVEKIWKGLRDCVRLALVHSKKELDDRPIDIVLLSGGSANLRWLEVLLKSDFKDDLAKATVLSLTESYQEVVAKGLAIECARRGYSEQSEFSDVTYNPLYLVLDPDSMGTQVDRRFKLVRGPEGIEEPTEPCELMPSAEALDTDEEQELEWKVSLGRPPKHHLDYYFTRGSTDPDVVEDRYNVVQTRLGTPADTHFKGAVRVQLHIRNDGTCTPRFIYRSDSSGVHVKCVEGEPFCIDLIAADQRTRRHAFVGIDFGTASSAISYVDWKQIQIFESRSKDELWLSLNELVDLPTPIALPIKTMLGRESDTQSARGALEAMLCFAAFVCWAEGSATVPHKLPTCFGGYWKRSAGPLKRLLFDLLDSRLDGPIVATFRKRLTAELRAELESVVDAVSQEKHDKLPPGSYDPKKVLEKLGNACKEALAGWEFGYFEDVRKAPFQQRFSGMFRIAEGAPPFHRQLRYEGSVSFSESEAVLVRPETGEVLSLSPLYVWVQAAAADPWSNCMVFDGVARGGTPTFKATGSAASLSLDGAEYDGLRAMVEQLVTDKATATLIGGCKFTDAEGVVE